MTFPGNLADLAFCDLTTVGRVTGRPHRIEIWFAHSRGTLYMLAGGGSRADWVRNVMATPAVIVHLDGTDFPGLARVVDDPAEQRLARRLVFDKYQPGYAGDLTDWRKESLPVAVDLTPRAEPATNP